jgi:hypothetical protein
MTISTNACSMPLPPLATEPKRRATPMTDCKRAAQPDRRRPGLCVLPHSPPRMRGAPHWFHSASTMAERFRSARTYRSSKGSPDSVTARSAAAGALWKFAETPSPRRSRRPATGPSCGVGGCSRRPHGASSPFSRGHPVTAPPWRTTLSHDRQGSRNRRRSSDSRPVPWQDTPLILHSAEVKNGL